jgi:DNA polymerase IIIc chi subunit
MTDSCQVDFYVLGSPSLDARQMACRLAIMSWERGHRTLVVTESHDSARDLDNMMWESPINRFLPHNRNDNGRLGSEAVLISAVDDLDQTIGNDAPSGDSSLIDDCVVINLCSKALPDPNRFSRLLEIVPQHREKYKYYRDQGIKPGSHEINK